MPQLWAASPLLTVLKWQVKGRTRNPFSYKTTFHPIFITINQHNTKKGKKNTAMSLAILEEFISSDTEWSPVLAVKKNIYPVNT